MPSWTSASPQSPIVAGSATDQTITFTVATSSSSVTWAVSASANISASVPLDGVDNGDGTFSGTVTYAINSTAPENATGTVLVTATNKEGHSITGTMFVLPSTWNADNITLVDDMNGNTYAVQNVASTDPTPMAIGLGTSGLLPDPIDLAKKAASTSRVPIEPETLSTSIACYVLLLGNFPRIGNATGGSGTGGAAAFDLRKLRRR